MMPRGRLALAGSLISFHLLVDPGEFALEQQPRYRNLKVLVKMMWIADLFDESLKEVPRRLGISQREDRLHLQVPSSGGPTHHQHLPVGRLDAQAGARYT